MLLGNSLLKHGVSTPASIAATSGTPQSANCGAAYAASLVATVKNAGGVGLAGISVTFTAPVTGASGTFASTGTRTETVVTNSSGMATSSAFIANGTSGDAYNVVASVGLLSTIFTLTNIPETIIFTQSPGTERVTNGDMELDSDWTAISTPTNTQSNEQAHGGTYSRKVVGNANQGIEQQNDAITAFRWYEYLMWLYPTAGGARLASTNPTASMPIDSVLNAWRRSSNIAFITGVTTTPRMLMSATGTTVYVDDVSIKDIVTNAQQVAYSANTPLTLEFTLPATPDFGQTARLYFRISGDFNRRKYWLAQCYYNGSAWEADLITVSGTTITTRLQNTDVGGVPDALRVRLNGTTLDLDVHVSGTWANVGNVTLDYLTYNTGVNIICSTGVTPTKLQGLSGQAVVTSQTLFSSVGEPNWYGRPRLCAVNASLWALIYRVATIHDFDASAQFNIHFSTDEGQTWSAANTYPDSGAVTGFPLVGHSGQNIADAEMFLTPNGDLMILASEWASPSSDKGTYIYRSVAGASIGKSWSDEGKLLNDDATHANGQVISIGNTIYATLWLDPDKNKTAPWSADLYTADADGNNWAHVTAIKTGANEGSLTWLGGQTLFGIFRDDNLSGQCYQAVSSDLGQTWTATPNTILGTIQRPRLLQPGDGKIYLVGRWYDEVLNLEKTVVWWTLDPVAASPIWFGPFYPNETFQTDGGYSDFLARSDGTHYLVTYEGTTTAANIIEYILSRPVSTAGQ